jgi:hypothetical protein
MSPNPKRQNFKSFAGEKKNQRHQKKSLQMALNQSIPFEGKKEIQPIIS